MANFTITKASRPIFRLPLGPEARVGVGCSGGLDSTVLLRLAAAVARKTGWQLWALHAHHGLRGREADADARFVGALAAELDVEARIGNVVVAPDGASLEGRARAARYAWFESEARTLALDALLLAHHADDQLETLWFRLERRVGLLGLGAIPEVRPLTSDCTLYRPLLSFRRRELEQLATAQGWTYRDDSSNRDPRHARTRLRFELLPAVLSANPGLPARLLAVADAARRTKSALQSWIALALPRRWSTEGCFVLELASEWLSLPDLAPWIWDRLTGLPPRRQDVLAFQELCARGRGKVAISQDRELGIGHGLLWVVSRCLSPHQPPESKDSGWNIPSLGTVIEERRFESSADSESNENSGPDSRWSVHVDRRRISGRLRWLLLGDKYEGLNESPRAHPPLLQKLKKLGVPEALRNRWPMAVDDLGLVWSPGLPLAARVRAAPGKSGARNWVWGGPRVGDHPRRQGGDTTAGLNLPVRSARAQ